MTQALEQPIVFECSGRRLVGVLHRAASSSAAASAAVQGAGRLGVLVVVGGPQYRAGSHRQFVLMARDLAHGGYPVFRFDYRGMGDSDGEPRSFERVTDDIRCAVDAFTSEENLTGVVLWGLCDAASACLMYGAADERVRAQILANPWVRTEAGEAESYIKHYYGRRLLQRSFWLKALKGELEIMASLRDFAVKLARARTARDASQPMQSFIERMRVGLQNFSGRVLVLMSEHDLTAQEFRELCRSDAGWRALMSRETVEICNLSGADHTFSSREALDRATQRCIEWLQSVEVARPALYAWS